MQIFAKRTLRFDPVVQPIVGFATEEVRATLIRASQPGDLLVFAGAVDDQIPVEDRGRLLGMAEFLRTPVEATALGGLSAFFQFELKEDGTPKFPKALPIIKAWAFQPKLKLIDTLKEQLTFEANIEPVRLDEDDARAVLALPRVEIHLQPDRLAKTETQSNGAGPRIGPTTGPIPVAWSGTVTRLASHEAYTYVLRFGERGIWKIGHTQDLASRLAEINQHVPHEELGESWSIALYQQHASSLEAYEMEQRVLGELNSVPYRW